MRILYSLLILILFTFQTYSLEAPYLHQATALNSSSIELTWRNNDVNTSNILILRKSEQADFETIKSFSVSTSNYIDNTLEANTEYTYCLIAQNNSNEYSDTSNFLSATTFDTEISFYVPLRPYNLTPTSLTLNFFDSCTIEKGFRLHTKQNNDDWKITDSINSKNPTNIDTLQFILYPDEKTCITYKIEAYNHTSSVFSPESTIYFFGQKEDFQYHFKKLATIPAKPISWVERLGDSLYFPEIVSDNDTQIAIINISEEKTLSFSGYLDISNIPNYINNSSVGIRVGNSSMKNFTANVGDFYYTFSNNHIYKYDSQNLIDSMDFSFLLETEWDQLTNCNYNGIINDSTLVFSIGSKQPSLQPYYKYSHSYIITSSNTSFTSNSSSNIFSWSYSTVTGAGAPKNFGYIYGINNSAITYVIGSSQQGYTDFKYHYSNFLNNFDSLPYNFIYSKKDNPYSGYNNGTKIANFERNYLLKHSINQYYICDFTDPLQDINYNYGTFHDSLIGTTNLNSVLIDSITSKIYFIQTGGLTVLSYEKGDVGINKDLTNTVNNFKKDIDIRTLSNNVQINFNIPINGSICIYNALGKKVFSSLVNNKTSFIWDKKNNSNTSVPSGFYCIKIKDKNFQISKSLVITN